MAACSATCTRTKTACILCLLVGCGFLATTTFLAGSKAAGLLQETLPALGLLPKVSEDRTLWQDTDNGGYNLVSGGVQRRLKVSRMMGSTPKARHHNALAMARSRGCAFNTRVCNDTAYHLIETPTCCGGSCIDVSHDSKHCGICNNACKLTEVCCNGQCTDLSKDPNNCGACDKICPDAVCLFGICGYY